MRKALNYDIKPYFMHSALQLSRGQDGVAESKNRCEREFGNKHLGFWQISSADKILSFDLCFSVCDACACALQNQEYFSCSGGLGTDSVKITLHFGDN